MKARWKGTPYKLKLNPVEAESTQSNGRDNFLPVKRKASLSTGPPSVVPPGYA